MSTPPEQLGLDVRESDGRITAVVTGCPTLVDGTAEQLGGRLTALIADRASSELLVDLGEITFLSSAALAQFLGVHRKLKDGGGHLVLCNLSQDVREVFTVTQLDRVIEVRPASTGTISG